MTKTVTYLKKRNNKKFSSVQTSDFRLGALSHCYNGQDSFVGFQRWGKPIRNHSWIVVVILFQDMLPLEQFNEIFNCIPCPDRGCEEMGASASNNNSTTNRL